MTRGGESKVASNAPHLHFMVSVGDDMVDILCARLLERCLFSSYLCMMLFLACRYNNFAIIDDFSCTSHTYLSITDRTQNLKRQLFCGTVTEFAEERVSYIPSQRSIII